MKAAIFLEQDSPDKIRAKNFIWERNWEIADTYTSFKKLLTHSNEFDCVVTRSPKSLSNDKGTMEKLRRHGLTVHYFS